jgi:Flp pilus assembly protein TadB
MDVELVVAVTQVLAALAVAIALIFSWRQARVMEASFTDLQESRSRQQLYEAHRYLDEIRDEIEHMLSLDKKEFSDWNEKDKAAVYIVCARFHIVGILVLESHFPERLISYAWYYSIPRCSEILGPYLASIREERGCNYWSAVDALAKRVQEHAKEFEGFC